MAMETVMAASTRATPQLAFSLISMSTRRPGMTANSRKKRSAVCSTVPMTKKRTKARMESVLVMGLAMTVVAKGGCRCNVVGDVSVVGV